MNVHSFQLCFRNNFVCNAIKLFYTLQTSTLTQTHTQPQAHKYQYLTVANAVFFYYSALFHVVLLASLPPFHFLHIKHLMYIVNTHIVCTSYCFWAVVYFIIHFAAFLQHTPPAYCASDQNEPAKREKNASLLIIYLAAFLFCLPLFFSSVVFILLVWCSNPPNFFTLHRLPRFAIF